MSSKPTCSLPVFLLVLLLGLVCFVNLSAATLTPAGQSHAAIRNVVHDTPAGNDITIFGQKIHYIETGSGPTVILLHGLGGNAENWIPTIPALAAKFHVVAIDQIGFGQSDKPLINYRVATYVDFLDQFCKQLKIARASLVGESMGGWVVAAFALAHPEKVERLILADAAGYALSANLDKSSLYGLNPSTREAMKVLAEKVFYNKAFSTDAVIDLALTQRMTAGDGYTIKSIIESIIRGEDFLDNRLQAIKQPTLIIWGREDGLVLLTDGQRFNREISNSTLVILEQCGHVPNVEKPAEFNAAILKFLSGQ